MSGKGDRDRTTDRTAYKKNYEKIFKNKKKRIIKDKSQIRPN
jgi:hypothetical protein|tara:strand:- start:9637 stop:9762 length:126 start_codon:yes stop_codon:yes gene_type:complete